MRMSRDPANETERNRWPNTLGSCSREEQARHSAGMSDMLTAASFAAERKS